MMQLSPQRSSLIATVLLAGGAVLFLVFFFKPKHEAIGALRGELTEKRQYLDVTGLVGESVQQATRDLEQVKSFVDRWEASSPTEAKLASHYARIAEAGKQAGVIITRFDPQPIERMKAIWRAPVEITVEGPYDDVFAFVHALESLDVTAWVDHLRIEKLTTVGSEEYPASSDSADGGKLRCEIDWVVFADYLDFSD